LEAKNRGKKTNRTESISTFKETQLSFAACKHKKKKETQNSDFDCTSRNKSNPTRHANRALITITINTRTVKASTVAQTETISMCIANISDHEEQQINEISKHHIVSSKQIIQ